MTKIPKRLLIITVTIMLLTSYNVYAYLNGLPYPISKYDNLLSRIKAQGYTSVQPRNFNDSCTAKCVLIAHDVDYKPDSAREFVQVESKYGFKSAFYLRPDAGYFTKRIPLFQSIQSQGWEIGFHYDTMSETGGNLTLARILFTAQVAYMRTFFNITTTRPHGDRYNPTISSGAVYDAALWSTLGLKEIHGVPFDVNDVGHGYVEHPFHDVMAILIHTDWWTYDDWQYDCGSQSCE